METGNMSGNSAWLLNSAFYIPLHTCLGAQSPRLTSGTRIYIKSNFWYVPPYQYQSISSLVNIPILVLVPVSTRGTGGY
jgi:hypothetical protein